MKIQITDLSPVRKALEIEVDSEVLQRETDAVVRSYAKRARLPGFRPGRAPRSVIESRFANQVREEVRDRLVARLYREATKDRGLVPLGDPRVEEIVHESGRPFRFRTVIEVLPEFEPRNYRGIEVRKRSVEVTPQDVDEALDALRQSRAKLVSEAGRSAQPGDAVILDLEGVPEGGQPFRREKVPVEIGAPHNLPGFNTKLLGATAGSTLAFPVEYPSDYPAAEVAGKKVAYAVQVHEVKRRELPELDDEFAKDLGEFDSLAALRETVLRDLRARREAEAQQVLRQRIVDKVLLENPIPLPEVLVEREIRHRMEDLVRAMMQQGLDPRRIELDWRELRERQEEGARKTVHARLVLDAVARIESVQLNESELEARLRVEAGRAGLDARALRERLHEGGGLEALRTQMVREKTLDLLTAVANIQTEEP